jgi:Ca2+-binding RTX toxin-like protein
MSVQGLTNRAGRTAMAISTVSFMVGLAFLNAGSAQSIGGICNGQPASHTWLDASGQPGPAILDGTGHGDTIIGSEGDDTIDGRGGDDVICAAGGNDSVSGGPGDDAIRGDMGGDDLDGNSGHDTVVGDVGNDTVAGGGGHDYLVGGLGDDVMISSDDDSVDKVDGGDDMDDCIFSAGDELANCEY